MTLFSLLTTFFLRGRDTFPVYIPGYPKTHRGQPVPPCPGKKRMFDRLLPTKPISLALA